jgi:hypothetical protein
VGAVRASCGQRRAQLLEDSDTFVRPSINVDEPLARCVLQSVAP